MIAKHGVVTINERGAEAREFVFVPPYKKGVASDEALLWAIKQLKDALKSGKVYCGVTAEKSIKE